MNPFDGQCVKSDVCGMAVCDGVYNCRHAVHKNMVRAQQAPNSESAPRFPSCTRCERFVLKRCDGHVDCPTFLPIGD
jgi:hypothetical protein